MDLRNPGKPNFRRLAALSSLGLVLPSAIVVGLFFGYWLDKILGTKPWMLLIFFGLGVASGFLSLIQGIKKYAKEEDEDGGPR
jgi:ATP synthase protein I